MRASFPTVILVLLSLAVACSDSGNRVAGPSPVPLPPPQLTPAGEPATIVAVGDIGMCSERPAIAATAALIDRTSGPLLLAGDLAYPVGSIQNFRDCFDPDYGRFRNRWYPVPGNHEYDTPGAAGYREYFGAAGLPSGRTFYSFRTGDWTVLMIDSNPPVLGPEQLDFIRSTMLASATPCTLAVWHHPLFSSGPNGPQRYMREVWRLLYDLNADVVISGHEHLYERFGKQDPDGRSDVRGLRQFTAGTGGARLYQAGRREPNSQTLHSTHGILQMTLHTTTYEWRFVNTSGAVLDTGTDGCH